MKHTIFRVSIWDGDCIVAMARMNGDMGLNYYIKDVVVRPEYQGKGIGRMLIDELRKNLCMLASRLEIYLPFCDEVFRTVVPKVVNRRQPGVLDGPNPSAPVKGGKKSILTKL